MPRDPLNESVKLFRNALRAQSLARSRFLVEGLCFIANFPYFTAAALVSTRNKIATGAYLCSVSSGSFSPSGHSLDAIFDMSSWRLLTLSCNSETACRFEEYFCSIGTKQSKDTRSEAKETTAKDIPERHPKLRRFLRLHPGEEGRLPQLP